MVSDTTRRLIPTTRRSIALLLSPVGLLLISAGRLIIVANFNTTTAVTIASSGGFVNTLLGSVIPLVPVFIPYLALLLLLFRRFLLSVMTFAFAAFISPTAITLRQGVSLARADWNILYSEVANYRTIAILAGLVLFLAVWAYNRSLAEGLSAIVAVIAALALLVAVPIVNLSSPLRLAGNREYGLGASGGRVHGFSLYEILIAILVFTVIFVILEVRFPVLFGGILSSYSQLLTVVVSLAATIALLPYVYYIYPVPQHRNYYAEATHAMWLPNERITLSTGKVYYGYVLVTDSYWFTVLLANSRTIAYIQRAEIVSRSVCQPQAQDQPKQYPPLIPWLYHAPSRLPACPAGDGGVVKPRPRAPGVQGNPQEKNRPQPGRSASTPVAGAEQDS